MSEAAVNDAVDDAVQALWSDAWALLERDVGPAQRAQLAALRAWLQASDAPHAQRLTGRRPAREEDAAGAHELAEAIVRHHIATAGGDAAGGVHPLSLASQRAQRWLQWIHQLRAIALRRAQRTGVALALAATPLIVPVHASASPHAPDRDALAADTERWRQAFLERLADFDPCSAQADPQRWWAAVLLSAVWCGALLHTTAVKQWLRCVHSDDIRWTDSGDPYVVLHAAGGQGMVQRRLWLPDPVSRLLLRRAPSLRPPRRRAAQLLRRAARWLQQPDLPTGLHALIDAARAWWHRRACPIALGVASHDLDNHDLHPRAWRDLMHTPSAHSSSTLPGGVPSGASDGRSSGTADDEALRAALAAEHPWLGCAWRALQPEATTAQRAQALADAESLVPETAAVVLSWLKAQLQRQPVMARPRLAGMRDVLLALVAWGGDDIEPILDGDDALQAVWSTLGEQRRACAQVRQQAGWALKSLLRHAGRSQALQAWQARLAADAELLSVDTRAVTLAEYRRALAHLQPALPLRDEVPEIREMACLLLMLAYRCGLRRREVLGLRLCDVTPEGWLLIRPHAARSLKTPASQRIVPAAWLLTPEEHQRFAQWVQHRRRQGAASQDRLFDTARGAVSEVRLAERVIEALAHVRGEGARLHQLRHAAASWTYLGLFAAQYPEVLRFFDHDEQQRAELQRLAALAPRLLGRAAPTTRAIAFALARLLGHVSPATSLQHYIHTQALVHAAITLRAAADVPAQTLQALTGLRKTRLYDALQSGGVLGVVRRRAARAAAPTQAAAPAPAASPTPAPIPVPPCTTTPAWPALSDVLRAFHGAAPPTLSPGFVDALRQALAGFDRAILLRCFGPDAVGPDWRPPMPQRHEEVDWLQRLQRALARASVRQRDLVRRGIALHFAHHDASRRDVVFRGPHERRDFEDYVRFLQCLPVDWTQHLRLVRRTQRGGLPAWLGEAPEWMRSLCIDHIAPPRHGAPAFDRWVGFRFTAKPGGRARPQVVLVTWLLWTLVDRVLDDGVTQG